MSHCLAVARKWPIQLWPYIVMAYIVMACIGMAGRCTQMSTSAPSARRQPRVGPQSPRRPRGSCRTRRPSGSTRGIAAPAGTGRLRVATPLPPILPTPRNPLLPCRHVRWRPLRARPRRRYTTRAKMCHPSDRFVAGRLCVCVCVCVKRGDR